MSARSSALGRLEVVALAFVAVVASGFTIVASANADVVATLSKTGLAFTGSGPAHSLMDFDHPHSAGGAPQLIFTSDDDAILTDGYSTGISTEVEGICSDSFSIGEGVDRQCGRFETPSFTVAGTGAGDQLTVWCFDDASQDPATHFGCPPTFGIRSGGGDDTIGLDNWSAVHTVVDIDCGAGVDTLTGHLGPHDTVHMNCENAPPGHYVADPVAPVEGSRSAEAVKRNRPPIAIDDGNVDAFASAKTGAAVTIPVLQNDIDPDGDVLTLASPLTLVGPAQCGFIRPTGVPPTAITYFPRRRGCPGVVKFSYRATDGKLDSNLAVVSVKVHHYNRAPKPVADVIKLRPARQQLSSVGDFSAYGWRSKPFDVLANDTDPDRDSLTVVGAKVESGLRHASNGQLSVSCAPGGVCVVDYAPNKKLPGKLASLRSDIHPPTRSLISYRVSDGYGNMSTATVRVTADTKAPVYGGDPYRGFAGQFQGYICVSGDSTCQLILGHGFLQKIVDNFSALKEIHDVASQIWNGGPEPDICAVNVVFIELGALCEATRVSLVVVVPTAVELVYRRLLLHTCARIDLTADGKDLAGMLTPNAVDGDNVGTRSSVAFLNPNVEELYSYVCRPLSQAVPKG